MPRVVRLYITSAILGFVIAGVFVGMIVAFNIANLRHLILTSDVGGVAIFVFWVLNGIVFSGVQFGYSVMRLASDDDST